MKHIVLLFLLMAGGFFGWRYLMKMGQRRLAGKWGRRVAYAVFFGALVVVGLFAGLTLTTWRLF